MDDGGNLYEAAKERVLAEYYAQVNGRTVLSFKETIELRAYAKARTNIRSHQLTADQVIWKQLYERLTEELRKLSPEWMAEFEQRETECDDLQRLHDMMAAKIADHPHDHGVRVWRAFVIMGPFIGWMRSGDLGTIVVYGLASWFVGLLFCIFALDSAEVQSKVAIFLHQKLRMEGISKWLYGRALTIR